MRTNKKLTTGSPASKKAIKPAALPARPITLAPQPTAPAAAATYWIKPVASPVTLESKPTALLAPATPEAKPSAAPLALAPRSTPDQPAAPAARAGAHSERGPLIEFAAYLLAEKDNFQGDPADYWRRGEAIVDANLGALGGQATQGVHGQALGNREGRLS